MIALTHSLTHVGAQPCRITIETDMFTGLPGMSVVGLGSKSIGESRDRLRSALRNSGLDVPPRKITINLAPADISKSGTGYDLAMAIGLLVASRQIAAIPETIGFIGELALDGSIRPAQSCTASVLSAAEAGFSTLVVDSTTEIDPTLCADIQLLRPHTLRELYLHFLGEHLLSPWVPHPIVRQTPKNQIEPISLSDIRGQTVAKRALEVAVTGHHNLLLIGSPGTGKSLLAKAASHLLPPATRQERQLVSYLHALAEQPPPLSPSGRPLRAPHTSSSPVALLGGGSQPQPGEVSLAQHGILLLDEIAEFPRSLLESLRQPLEDGQIHISRAAGKVSYPAQFLLIATMNPCPCGFAYSQAPACTCSPAQVSQYRQRLSGPLLDRFDIICQVEPPTSQQWQQTNLDSTADVAARIAAGRGVQLQRSRDLGIAPLNGQLLPSQLLAASNYEPATESLVDALINQHISPRSLHRIQKVARTIADLAGQVGVGRAHIEEALFYKQTSLDPATIQAR